MRYFCAWPSVQTRTTLPQASAFLRFLKRAPISASYRLCGRYCTRGQALPRFHLDCLQLSLGLQKSSLFCNPRKSTLFSSTFFNFPRHLGKSTVSAPCEFSRGHRASTALSSGDNVNPPSLNFILLKNHYFGNQY